MGLTLKMFYGLKVLTNQFHKLLINYHNPLTNKHQLLINYHNPLTT